MPDDKKPQDPNKKQPDLERDVENDEEEQEPITQRSPRQGQQQQQGERPMGGDKDRQGG
jgi:hypothetical protein